MPWKRVNPTSCDIREVRSLGMKLAQEKAKAFRDAGVPVSGEVMSDILKASYAEVKAECKPVNLTVTPEQMEAVKKVCSPCAKRFALRGQAKLSIEEQPAAELVAETRVKPGQVTEAES